MVSTSNAAPFIKRRRWQRFVWPAVGVLVFTAGVWLGREPLLRVAAELWIVSDAAGSSDVVAVLGGGLETRPFVAAELYQEGLVKKILVSRVLEGRASSIGAIRGHTDSNLQVLHTLGIPETVIETFGQENRSTRDEAAALRAWVDQHHVSQIVIPTEVFSARRVRWIFDREFAGTSVRLAFPAVEPPDYTGAEWWKTEAGMIAFQNEVLKYIYYRFKY
jgi:uncharacterized SAM-binding protein YcdF (DUF218 family)